MTTTTKTAEQADTGEIPISADDVTTASTPAEIELRRRARVAAVRQEIAIRQTADAEAIVDHEMGLNAIPCTDRTCGTHHPPEPRSLPLTNLIVSAGSFVQRDIPDTTWLVEGLIPAAGTAAFVGYAKAGKSTVAVQLAHSIHHGIPFMGRSVIQTKTLFHDEEGAERPWQDRIAIPARALGLDPNALDFDFLHRKGVRWTDQERFLQLLEYVIQNDIGLVITGPLRQIADLEDENKPRDINNLMRDFNMLAQETGCSVLILQHPRKRGRMDKVPSPSEFFEAAAGSNALEGAVDAAIGIHRPDDEQPNSGLLYWRTRERSNHGPTLGYEGYAYDPATYLIRPADANFSSEGIKDQRVIDLLYEKGWTKAADIAQALHVTEKTARERVKPLLARDVLRETKHRGDHGDYGVWDLSEEHRQTTALRRGDPYIATDDLDILDEPEEDPT